jgi:hypothetical protein
MAHQRRVPLRFTNEQRRLRVPQTLRLFLRRVSQVRWSLSAAARARPLLVQSEIQTQSSGAWIGEVTRAILYQEVARSCSVIALRRRSNLVSAIGDGSILGSWGSGRFSGKERSTATTGSQLQPNLSSGLDGNIEALLERRCEARRQRSFWTPPRKVIGKHGASPSSVDRLAHGLVLAVSRTGRL